MASLKLFFISVVLLVAIVSVSMGVTAADEKVVKVKRVSVLKNSGVVVIVGVEAQEKFTDSKLTVSIPELDLRARHNVDFSRTNKKTVHLEIPIPQMLDPYVKIVFNSDEGRRVKYRPLIFG